jgi:hypothetical protein
MKCRHTFNEVSLFIQYRADGQPYEPTIPMSEQGEPVSWRCAMCLDYADLGAANDTPEALIELRAAEIAATGEPRYRHGIPESQLLEGCGWVARDMGLDADWCRGRPDGLAGWLAHCIATHTTTNPARDGREE